MKIFTSICVALSLLCSIGKSASARNVELELSVTPIAKNVYGIISPFYGRPSHENSGWNSNSYFVVTEKGVLVFDTGSSELIGKEILKAVKSVTDQPVRWVVNSHSHADHWLGNAAFTDTGASILSTSLAIRTMKKDGRGDIEAFARTTEGATTPTRAKYPTSFLNRKEKRNLGGLEVEFIYSNDGHSPGDVLMWLPKQKIIFGGDVLNSEWMPIMTPRGKVANLIDTLNIVLEMKPSIVLPGHGKVATLAAVKRDRQLLGSVTQQISAALENGERADTIPAKVVAELHKEYKTLYRDYDNNIEYLVNMIFKKLIANRASRLARTTSRTNA